jgi:predicted transcriptional regulator
MALAKKEIIRYIEKLPDDYSLDEIIAELYFKQQVEEGLRDVQEGRVYSHETVKNMVTEWRKSTGRL